MYLDPANQAGIGGGNPLPLNWGAATPNSPFLQQAPFASDPYGTAAITQRVAQQAPQLAATPQNATIGNYTQGFNVNNPTPIENATLGGASQGFQLGNAGAGLGGEAAAGAEGGSLLSKILGARLLGGETSAIGGLSGIKAAIPGGTLAAAGIPIAGNLLGGMIQNHVGLNTTPYHLAGALKGGSTGYGLGAGLAGLLTASDVIAPEVGVPLSLAAAGVGGLLGFMHHGHAGPVAPNSEAGTTQQNTLINNLMQQQLSGGGISQDDFHNLRNQYNLAMQLAGKDLNQQYNVQQSFLQQLPGIVNQNQAANQQQQQTLAQQATVAKLIQPYVQNLMATAKAEQQTEQAQRQQAPAELRPLMDLVANNGISSAAQQGASMGENSLQNQLAQINQLYNTAQTVKNKGKSVSTKSSAANSLAGLIGASAPNAGSTAAP